MNRPFTRVRQMQAVAEAKFQSKIKELEDERTKAQSRLNELQQNKDKDQRFILSKEQKAEIDNLRKQEGRVAQDLKKVQKDLRKEVVSLETRLKWVNILSVPLAVTLTGLVIALIKRKRTSAK
jgi:seryl-tRNA synthetase